MAVPEKRKGLPQWFWWALLGYFIVAMGVDRAAYLTGTPQPNPATGQVVTYDDGKVHWYDRHPFAHTPSYVSAPVYWVTTVVLAPIDALAIFVVIVAVLALSLVLVRPPFIRFLAWKRSWVKKHPPD